MDVVAADSREQFSLSILVLPLLELPVLPVDEDGDHTGPPRLSEVRHTVVHIKLDILVANAPAYRNHLTRHDRLGRSHLHRFLLIVAILEERLDVGE